MKTVKRLMSVRIITVLCAITFGSTILLGDWTGSDTFVHTMGQVSIGTTEANSNPNCGLYVYSDTGSAISEIETTTTESATLVLKNNYGRWVISNFRNNGSLIFWNQPEGSPTGRTTFALHDNGDVTFKGTVTAQNYACSSDSRFKKNVTQIGNALDKVMSLNGVTYDWKTEKFKDRNFTSDRQIGFLAQDVEKVIPEVVFTDDKGYKSVSYAKLTALIVEALKENKNESDAKMAALEMENLKLKQKIASLEKMSDRIAALEKAAQSKSVAVR